MSGAGASRMVALAAAALIAHPAAADAQPMAAGAPGPVARRALAAPGHRWRHTSTPHADIYVLAGSAAERIAPALGRTVERAIAANLRWLGASGPPPRLRLFVVGRREEMRPFSGGTPGGWSVVDEGTAFLVGNGEAAPPVRHETMHLLSWRLWGPPGGVWLSEGVATAAGGRCGGVAFDDAAAALAAAVRLVPFDTLRAAFTFRGERGAAQYLQAASVVGYVRRVHGPARLRRLWRAGLRGAEGALGVSAAELERGWLAAIRPRRPSVPWDELGRAVTARGCE